MIKICHITPFFDEQYGGSERYVDTISQHQAKVGLDVTIVTTTRYRHKVGKQALNGRKIVRFFSYHDVWKINPAANIIPFLRKYKFDVIHIHSHLYFISNLGVIFGKIKRIPVLLHLHGGIGLPPYKTTLLKRTAKTFYDKTVSPMMFASADMIASVSKHDLNNIKRVYKIPDSKLVHIPNTVNMSLFKNTNKGNFEKKNPTEVLYVGDMELWKGIGFLEKWIRDRCLSFKEKLTFRFIGDGTYASSIRRLQHFCKDTNIQVEFLGPQPHQVIPRYLANSSALILPSYWEGAPTVVLEAMASKTPVITTPVGEIPYIIKNRKNGVFFDHNNSSLDQALNYMLNDPPRAKKMALNAYNTIKKTFTVESVHKNVLNAYSHLTNGRI